MKYTCIDERGKSVEGLFDIKSKEDFPITETVDFDAYKLLLTISQFCDNLRKQKPIKFEKENFQITDIRCIGTNIGIHELKNLKNDIYNNPIDFLRGGIVELELDYIDKNKSIPNHNICVKTLNNSIVNEIKQILIKNGIHVNLFLDNGDYPINLKSDYRGNEISLFVDIKNNSADIEKHEKEFDLFCEKAFKQFIGTKLKQKTTITKIEPYDSEHFSNGLKVFCNNLDDVAADYNILYEFEDKINKLISSCPLNKIYEIQFQEEGYNPGGYGKSELYLDYYCMIKPKK